MAAGDRSQASSLDTGSSLCQEISVVDGEAGREKLPQDVTDLGSIRQGNLRGHT